MYNHVLGPLWFAIRCHAQICLVILTTNTLSEKFEIFAVYKQII